jgi:hypothetical protein
MEPDDVRSSLAGIEFGDGKARTAVYITNCYCFYYYYYYYYY